MPSPDSMCYWVSISYIRKLKRVMIIDPPCTIQEHCIQPCKRSETPLFKSYHLCKLLQASSSSYYLLILFLPTSKVQSADSFNCIVQNSYVCHLRNHFPLFSTIFKLIRPTTVSNSWLYSTWWMMSNLEKSNEREKSVFTMCNYCKSTWLIEEILFTNHYFP